MSRRNQPRKKARQRGRRSVKPRILVVCEGKETERQYLQQYKKACRNSRVELQFANESGLDPKSLVRVAKKYNRKAESEAKRQKDSFVRFDEVWCVFDRDDHLTFFSAIEMARDNNFKVAASNPAFELWLLLHFRENPGAQDRTKILEMLKIEVPGFQKEQIKYADYQDGYIDAVRRAEQMDELALQRGESKPNPSTGVYQLTESIREDT
jgi:hypothetical protein